DGIRDRNVTGVQTCALPILAVQKEQAHLNMENHFINLGYDPERPEEIPEEIRKNATVEFNLSALAIEEEALENELAGMRSTAPRSEERRVGKEWRSRRADVQ